MDRYMIMIITAILIGVAALAVSIVFLRCRYRKEIDAKNRALARRLCEQSRLEKELERTRIEKDAMEKLITGNLKNAQQASGAEEEEDNR